MILHNTLAAYTNKLLVISLLYMKFAWLTYSDWSGRQIAKLLLPKQFYIETEIDGYEL
jgi:hypothetical protein